MSSTKLKSVVRSNKVSDGVTKKKVARTFSLDVKVVEAIDKFAKADNRTPSNALETLLLKHFDSN